LTNNDILRRLRYSFEFNDNKMITLFDHTGTAVTREQISSWLKKEDDEGYVEIKDVEFATFLNGLIIEKRGKREGPQPEPENKLNFNIILTKLKIALNLKAEDIIEMLNDTKVKISKPELSAFFRKPDHKHYRTCKAQIIRNFLMAIQTKYRKSAPPSAVPNIETPTYSKPEKKHASKDFTPRDNSEHTPNTARPNASAIYVNPKAAKAKKPKSERKVLKLKPEDIWGTKDK
jgi:uncharacterized protein YehS (DUF1456 family)